MPSTTSSTKCVRERVSRSYVDAILTPVERRFTEAVGSGHLTGDSALVRLFLEGARPRT